MTMRAQAQTNVPAKTAVTRRLFAQAMKESAAKGFTARVHHSIAEISRDAWLRLFPSAEQTWDYYAAAERMTARAFKFGAIGVYFDKTLVGAAPLFRVAYRLDAPLGPQFQAMGDWLDRHAPSWITMPMIGLGSPVADECQIGMHPALTADDRSLEEANDDPKPFVWTADPDKVLAAVKRGKQTLESIH